MIVRAVIAGLVCLVALEVAVLVAGSGGRSGGALPAQPLLGRGSSVARTLPAATPTPRTPLPPKATAVGDSVLLSASAAIVRELPGIDIDAVVGRGVAEGIDALRERAGRGKLGDTVVVHLGNNGEFTDGEFEDIAAIAGPERRLVFVTVRVGRSWEGPNNEVIVRGVARHGNAVLVDWHAASAGRPELLWEDGVHLRPQGVAAYSRLVVDSVLR